MKKNLLAIIGAVALCVILGIAMVSCSHSSDKITSRQITKLYNKQLKENAASQEFVDVITGYYETTPDMRCMLKKLEAAGVITVSFERFAWWEKIEGTKKVKQTYYDFWYGASTRYVTKKVLDYVFEDHIMATVALTDAGKKLVVSKVPEPIEKVDKDMIQPKIDTSKCPELSVTCAEEWPEIKNPFIEKKEDKKEAKPKEEKKEQTEEPAKDDGVKVERRDNAQYLAYFEAQKKVTETHVMLKGCKVKALKARNIQIVNENGIRTAVAEVIVETKDVSPAYRSQNNVISGQKIAKPVVLTYYLDKGWVILHNPLMDFTEKYMEKWESVCKSALEALDDLEKEEGLENGDKEEKEDE